MKTAPLFVVCEDGSEYLDRFRRFLGEAFRFVPARDFAEAAAAVAGAAGLLLDLDFRRTPPARLVDEHGPATVPLDEGTRRRLSESQGILILRQLRATGATLPTILFADLDDPARATFLARTLGPLTLVPSRTGLREVAELMREMIAATPGGPPPAGR